MRSPHILVLALFFSLFAHANDEQALLAAIRAHPDEDTPRLAYADWLQEHGNDARAEFIRVQIERERTPPGLRRQELVNRERALLNEHSEAWIPKEVTQCCSKPKFRRGFVEEVEVVSSNLFKPAFTMATSYRAALELPGLTHIVLHLDDHETAERWKAQLESASLTGKHVKVTGGAPRNHFAHGLAQARNSRLIGLEFQGDSPTGSAATALANTESLSSLKSLKMTMNPSVATSFAHSKHVRGIEELHIGRSGTDFTSDEVLRPLIQSTNFKNLRSLTVQSNLDIDSNRHREFVGDTIVSEIARPETSKVNGLVTLRFRQDRAQPFLSDKGLATIANSRSFSALKELEVEYGETSATGLKSLADSKYVTLRRLLLHNGSGSPTPVGEAQVIADSPRFSELEYLELPNRSFDDADAVALANSKHLGKLTTLVLTNRTRNQRNRLGALGVAALINSPRFDLTELLLEEAVADGLPGLTVTKTRSNLRRLDVRSTGGTALDPQVAHWFNTTGPSVFPDLVEFAYISSPGIAQRVTLVGIIDSCAEFIREMIK